MRIGENEQNVKLTKNKRRFFTRCIGLDGLVSTAAVHMINTCFPTNTTKNVCSKNLL